MSMFGVAASENKMPAATSAAGISVCDATSLLRAGRDIYDVQGVGGRVHGGHNLHALAFELLRFVLIIQLIAGLSRGLLQHKLAAGFRDLAFEGAGGLLGLRV